LPTEYLFYYYHPQAAIENVRKAGQTRGNAIVRLNEQLFHDLAGASVNRQVVYEQYLKSRSGGYMQIESGSAEPIAPPPSAALTGYDRIALAVVRAMYFSINTIVPLDVRNHGTLPDLDDRDIIEVPCVVNIDGAQPLHVRTVPAHARDLILRVKEYERLTI